MSNHYNTCVYSDGYLYELRRPAKKPARVFAVWS